MVISQGGEVVRVGDDVELAPAPGEAAAQVSRIEAIWAERRPDGQERLLARVRRFYRPFDTPFVSRGRARELFLSGHVDDRVPLRALPRRCAVAMHPLGALPSVADPGPGRYICMFEYDHIGGHLMQLRAGW